VEDANVVKPTVTTGSKSGTPATELGVGNGIGLDAAQGTAEPKTPAETRLGATVSDTSTDNVPEGSQSAALRAQMAEWRADETAAKEARIAAAAAQAAAKLEEAKIAAEADPANKTAPGNEEFDFDFDEGFAEFDAARRAEKVAADLDAEVAAQAAAELKDAQLPSIDEEVLDTVEGLGGARAAADARTTQVTKKI
jgi:hypothetical protein